MISVQSSRRHHIRTKLSAVFSVLVGVISLFIYFYFPERLAEQNYRALSDKTQSIARMASYRIAPALYFDDSIAARETIASARMDSNIVYLVLLNDSGGVFIAYNLQEAERTEFRKERFETGVPGNQDILATVTPVIHNNDIIGHFYLGMSLSGLRSQISATRLTILIVSLLVFAVGVILVYGLTTIVTRPLIQMADAVGHIASGDLARRVTVSSRDEVGALGGAVNNMVESLASAQRQLQEINRDLEKRVEHRTELLAHSEEALRRSGEQLRALSAHLQKIREEERTYIAQEIHDELGQMLTAINIDLAVIEKQLLKSDPSPAVLLAIRKMQSLSELVETTIQSTRRLALELRPDVLDNLGLVAALEWQAHEFQSRTGITCLLQSQVEALAIDSQRSTAVFRIFQEALTNISRHAQATRIEICLLKREEVVVLEIRDNGRGINQSDILGMRSLGIIGMRERAMYLGGEVRIVGKPGEGTTVTVEMPLNEPDTA